MSNFGLGNLLNSRVKKILKCFPHISEVRNNMKTMCKKRAFFSIDFQLLFVPKLDLKESTGPLT